MTSRPGTTPLAFACLFLLAGSSAVVPVQARSAPQQSASAGQAVDDAWITAKVKSTIATTDGVSASRVSVSTANGVVTLTGVVPNQNMADRAIAVTRTIKGVVRVDAAGLKTGHAAPVAPANTPAHSSGPVQAVDDSWITTKVKAALAATDGVSATAVDVKTVNGVVTLRGVLDSSTSVKKAIAAARSVDGVKQVDAVALTSR